MNYVYMYVHPERGKIYVGRTNNLLNRLKTHKYDKKDNIDNEYKPLLDESGIFYIELSNTTQSICVESYLIEKYRPYLNKALIPQEESIINIEMKLPPWKKYDETLIARKNEKEQLELKRNEINDSIVNLKNEINLIEKEYNQLRNQYIVQKSKTETIQEILFEKQQNTVPVERKNAITLEWEEIRYFIEHTDIDLHFAGTTYDSVGNIFHCTSVVRENGFLSLTYGKNNSKEHDINLNGIFTDTIMSLTNYIFSNSDIEIFRNVVKNLLIEIKSMLVPKPIDFYLGNESITIFYSKNKTNYWEVKVIIQDGNINMIIDGRKDDIVTYISENYKKYLVGDCNYKADEIKDQLITDDILLDISKLLYFKDDDRKLFNELELLSGIDNKLNGLAVA